MTLAWVIAKRIVDVAFLQFFMGMIIHLFIYTPQAKERKESVYLSRGIFAQPIDLWSTYHRFLWKLGSFMLFAFTTRLRLRLIDG